MTDSTGTLVPFKYGDAQVRVVTIDGEPWFVLADLCKVLEISDVSIVRRRLDDALCQTHPIRDALGRTQNATVVSEAGMYEVVIRSDKPEAAAFRRWITADVLPSIRKTGGYQAAPALPTDRTELLALAVLEADQMIREKDDQIAAMEPKAEYVDTYVADEDHFKFSTVASTLDMKETELRELLVAKGWIYCETTSRWSETKGRKVTINRYSEYAHKKPYFYRSLTHDAPRFRGEVMHTLKITAPGAQAVARLVKRGEDAPVLEVVS